MFWLTMVKQTNFSKKNMMLFSINPLYLHCVFHGIRFKVNNGNWLSVMDGLFLYVALAFFPFWD